MTRDGARWQRVQDLCVAALECEPAERDAFLTSACAGDQDLREEIESLLAHEAKADSFLSASSLERWAQAVVPRSSVSHVGDAFGPYDIQALIGAGGMGEVYRARDRRLHRDVAVKVLPSAFSGDPYRLRRFEQEARAAAALNHPNILAVYDIGTQDGEPYIVSECLAGETLAQRLARGPLSLLDAMDVAIQLGHALAAAHEIGIVHRDLKPANIFITHRLQVKVLDFGLAKIRESCLPIPVGTDPSLETLTTAGVGTLVYMSPEQIAGAQVDPRLDIWSLGVVLYEVMTGQRPFRGEGRPAVAAAIASATPAPPSSLRTEIPADLDRVLKRALAKDPVDRPSADELISDLQSVRFALARDPARRSPANRRLAVGWPLILRPTSRAVLTLAIVAGLVVLGAAATMLGRRSADIIELGSQTRLTNDTGLAIDPEFSPDGRFLAFSVGLPGHMLIEVREIASGRTTAMTDAARGDERRPRWSPQGTRLLFSDGDTLFTESVAGAGVATAVTHSTFIRSAAWTLDGKGILFLAGESLFRVAAAGGVPVAVRPLDAQSFSLSISPDGSRIAYASGNPDFETGTTQFANIGPSAIYVAPIGGGAPTEITDHAHLNTSPIWSPDGRALFFVSDRDGRRDIYVVRMHAGLPQGDPLRLTTGLDAHTIGLSRDGRVLTYSLLTRRSNIWSVPILEAGTASSKDTVPITSGNQTIEEARVSGHFLYFDSDLDGHMNLYRIPLWGGRAERLTSDSWDEFINGVSPDGQTIAFHAFRNGRREVFVMPAVGGPAKFVGVGQNATWSPDGSRIIFATNRQQYGDPAAEIGATWNVVEDSAPRPWTSLRQFTLAKCQVVGWRPDGRSFLGFCQEGIQILGMDGSVLKTVYNPKDNRRDPIPEAARPSPDGRTIYFKSYDSEGRASFWSVSVVGGAPRLIARLDDMMRPANRTDFDTDGRKIYFTLDDRQSDVWVVDVRKGGR